MSWGDPQNELVQPPRGPLVKVVAFGVLLIALALVFTPNAATPSEAVDAVSRGMADLGAPTWLSDPVLWERVLNVLLFFPLGFFGMLWAPRLRLIGWTSVGFVLSGSIEFVQAVLLPARDGSVGDILTNTAGAFLGAFSMHLLRVRRPRAVKR